MRNVLLSLLLFAGQPVLAATQSLDFSVTFERDYFLDVYLDEAGPVKLVDGGALDGVSGTFSDLKPGDSISVAVELEGQGPYYSLTSCELGGMACGGDFVQYVAGEALLITDFVKTLSVNFETGKAFFVDDRGVSFDEGSFRSYGADFAIENGLSVVPAPLSASLLITGMALLGFKRRRKG